MNEETVTVGYGRTPVTVVGLGAMGSALAGAFLKAAHPTTVWNRSPEKADSLVARGAVRADTADAVAASPLVVISALNYAAVREILAPAGDAVSDRVLVNLTSGTPDQARETARWAAERGAEYIDGGILGDPEDIGTPQARLYYSGRRDRRRDPEEELPLGAAGPKRSGATLAIYECKP